MVGENAVKILCTLGEGMSTSTGCKLFCDWDALSDDKKTTIQNYTTLSLSLALALSLSLSDIIKVIQFITSLVTSKLQAKICWEKKYVTLYKTLTRCEKDIFHV